MPKMRIDLKALQRSREAAERAEAQAASQAAEELPSGAGAAEEQRRSRLTTCPDCGRDVSRQAETCPHCGAPGPAASGEQRAQRGPSGGTFSEGALVAFTLLSLFVPLVGFVISLIFLLRNDAPNGCAFAVASVLSTAIWGFLLFGIVR